MGQKRTIDCSVRLCCFAPNRYRVPPELSSSGSCVRRLGAQVGLAPVSPAKEKRRADEARRGREELRGHQTSCGSYVAGSSGVANLAAYFVARFVVNRRHIVLLATMLFGLAQHFVWTGALRFP